MFSVFCVCVCVLCIRSRGCGKADKGGNIDSTKSDLTFPCEQSLWQDSCIGYAKCVWVVVAEMDGHRGFILTKC